MSAADAEQLTFQNFRCSAKHQEADVPTFLCLSEEISLTALQQLTEGWRKGMIRSISDFKL